MSDDRVYQRVEAFLHFVNVNEDDSDDEDDEDDDFVRKSNELGLVESAQSSSTSNTAITASVR